MKIYCLILKQRLAINNFQGNVMKKDYSLFIIILCNVFAVCSLGINILYYRRFPAMYLAGIIVSAVVIVANIVFLVLRLKYKKNVNMTALLMRICLLTIGIALAIPAIGTLVIMYN